MAAPSLSQPVSRALATVAMTLLALVASLTGLPAASGGSVPPNPTGVNAGSVPNGVGSLELSLIRRSDGRIKVSWVPPGPVRRLEKYVVKVGPTRKLDAEVKKYRVSRKRQSVVVDRAAGAVPNSGNYTFVKVFAYRKAGGKGASATKWTQAPLGAPCAALPEDRVTVGSFNVRTWAADSIASGFGWDVRGPNVIVEILRSGAGVLAVQEASGKAHDGFGPKNQRQWILDALNLADPTANWVDGVADSEYTPGPGEKGGLIGTRVFYDAARYDALDSGLFRISDPESKTDSLLPWVRLQAVGGEQAPFIMTSSHLRVGVDRLQFEIRGRQIAKTISRVENLRATYPGDQVIVAGDLNSTANTKPYNNVQRDLMAAGYYDGFATADLSGAQYPTSNMYKFPLSPTPHRRDYIMSIGSVKGSCSYENMHYAQKSRVASDHFMQVATLPLPPG